jgi:hypothetical protein
MRGVEMCMKRFVFVLVFFVGVSAFGIYGQTKNDDIVRLLRISGSDKMSEQVFDAMILQFNTLPGVPNEFWVRFRQRINFDDLLYQMIPIYDRYYTHDEIKQLIAFYGSPLGRKMVEVAPSIMQESMAIGQSWGERLGQNIVNELIREGYIRN